MKPKELALYIANRYKETSLIKRFGEGEVTSGLTQELEGEITRVIEELRPLAGLESIALPIHPSFPSTDLGQKEDGIVYFGDIGFEDNRVISKRHGEWCDVPVLTYPRKALRFLIERSGKAFSAEDMSLALSISQTTVGGYCSLILNSIEEYSDVYRGFREGRAPTKYGLRKSDRVRK